MKGRFCASKHFSVAQECSLLLSPALARKALLGWDGSDHLLEVATPLSIQRGIWVVYVPTWFLRGKFLSQHLRSVCVRLCTRVCVYVYRGVCVCAYACVYECMYTYSPKLRFKTDLETVS